MTEEKKTRSKRYEIKENKENITKTDKPINEENKEMNPKLKKFLIILGIIIIGLITYSGFIEPKLLNIKEYKIETTKIPNSFHGLKIIQFSDIHYGTTINKKELNKIVNKINNLKPDIIIFTGDLIDKNIIPSKDTKNDLITILSKLKCSLYKYAIYGNEDNTKEYKDIITSSGFKLLNNESTLLYYQDKTPIIITGFNNNDNDNPNYTILTNYIDELDPNSLYKIVLTHEPDYIDKFINYHPNLVLSGHTMGGLIKLPFLKPMFLEPNSKKYYKNYYHINDTEFYISNGLGTSGINARFNNPPTINLYRLYKTKGNN